MSKVAKEDESGVHGDTFAHDSFVGGVLLEVGDHLMGGPGLPDQSSMEPLRRNIQEGKWHRLMQDGASFFWWSQEGGWGFRAT